MHTALAVGNKIIHLLQILPERGVHRRSAGKLHVSKIDSLFFQTLAVWAEGICQSGTAKLAGASRRAIGRFHQSKTPAATNRPPTVAVAKARLRNRSWKPCHQEER